MLTGVFELDSLCLQSERGSSNCVINCTLTVSRQPLMCREERPHPPPPAGFSITCTFLTGSGAHEQTTDCLVPSFTLLTDRQLAQGASTAGKAKLTEVLQSVAEGSVKGLLWKVQYINTSRLSLLFILFG